MRTEGRITRTARLAARCAMAAAAAGVIVLAAGGDMVSAAPAKAPRAAKSVDGEAADKTPVDINTADAEKLASLPGIGASIAQRIVDYRKEHGPFKSVDELVNVRGVGDKLLARLRDRLTVGTKD